VSGTNIGGEPFERLAHETFLVVDQSSRLANLLPGTCATGQFDCGDQSTCIDAVKLADCVPDCPNGLDEARAKTSSLCMANSTICMPGDVTGQPTPTTPASTTPRSPCAYCAPDDVYKDVEPVSAAFTILMRDPADISKIADSIDSSIGNLINAFPNRLENIVLTPSNTNSAIVPGDVKTAVNALTANVTSNCAKSIITSAIQAVDSAENGSTLTVFIDSYASDLDLGDQLLAKAVRKGIKVNVVLLDSSCSCICTEQNRESNTTDLLEKITKITHGSFYEVPNSADAINKVAVAAINGLYPNALSLARMSATKGSVSTSVPVDSGLISMQTQAQ
uniref:VWFA domain-containing protein n=1 Tax=Plectus sambesii TaxID=2011161 RepID=A0A914UQP9_9BILA